MYMNVYVDMLCTYSQRTVGLRTHILAYSTQKIASFEILFGSKSRAAV